MPPMDGQQSPQGQGGEDMLDVLHGGRAPGQPPPEDVEPDEATIAYIRNWCARIKKSKRRFEDDFKRMRENREFTASFQWIEQVKIDDDRYINNMVLRAVNKKVADYYARNPKAEWERRPRLDFIKWDGELESLAQALMSVQQASMMRMPPPMDALTLLQDFTDGSDWQHLVERIGKTLETVYQWQIDNQEPSFKEMAKKWVLRTCINGVGYMKINFVRDIETTIEAPLSQTDVQNRVKAVKAYMEDLDEKEITEDDAKYEELRSTLLGLIADQSSQELNDVNEKLVISFPRTSSIIPDWNCIDIRTFEGANWLAEERILPLELVNEFYEVDIEPSSDVMTYTERGNEFFTRTDAAASSPEPVDKFVCLWTVYDKKTRTMFTICDGWKNFIEAPEPVYPKMKRFWPFFSLVFNAIDVEPGDKCSIFPPSDVQLMKSAQKEKNRSRQALRQHRKANTPRWVSRAGAFTESDKLGLREADPHSTTEVNIPDGMAVDQVMMPVPMVPIVPQNYDASPMEQDIELAVGAQQANLGPAQGNVTATVGSIAEQSRMTLASSNVDDLDMALSALAEAASEILLREMSQQTVLQIAGKGAVWPDPMSKEDFINELFLKVQAASSGRPNKGVEMANLREMIPLLLQAGANPKFLVEEMVARWDDRLDVTRAFPLLPPDMGAMMPPPGGPPPPNGGPPPQAGPPDPTQRPPNGPGAPLRQLAPPMPPRPGVD